MAKKYYAVAKGKTPGIYFSWEACKAQVAGYSGAVYKGFTTINEAEEFVAKVSSGQVISPTKKATVSKKANVQNTKEMEEALTVSTKEHLVAYVDGSYEHSKLRYAYGCALVFSEEVIELNGSGNDADYVSMRNVAGEILGSEHAISWAIEHGYKAITIYYDYEGIEKWANGIWKANKVGTKRYQEFVKEKRENIQIFFQKVAAHTGVMYNELADQLAKAALGL